MIQDREKIRLEIAHAQELVEKRRNVEADEEARRLLECALAVFEKHVPYDGSCLETVYYDLGNICYKMNDLLSSLDYYHKARFFLRVYALVDERTNELSEVDHMINKINQEIGLHVKRVDNLCCYVDKSENVVIPGAWKDATEFSEGLAAVQNEDDLWGYIDYHGKIIIPCKLDYVEPFENGIAGMSKDEDNCITCYYDVKGESIGVGLVLDRYEIQDMSDASLLFLLGKHEEAVELILPVAENKPDDINPRKMLVDFYAEMGQNDKVVEWCKRVIRCENNQFDYLSPLSARWPRLYLGYAYEYGLGVEQDLMKAFKLYYDVKSFINLESEQLDEFLERHPEMKELPEVQDALITSSDDLDY